MSWYARKTAKARADKAASEGKTVSKSYSGDSSSKIYGGSGNSAGSGGSGDSASQPVSESSNSNERLGGSGDSASRPVSESSNSNERSASEASEIAKKYSISSGLFVSEVGSDPYKKVAETIEFKRSQAQAQSDDEKLTYNEVKKNTSVSTIYKSISNKLFGSKESSPKNIGGNVYGRPTAASNAAEIKKQNSQPSEPPAPQNIGGNVYGRPTAASNTAEIKKQNFCFWVEEHTPERLKPIGRGVKDFVSGEVESALEDPVTYGATQALIFGGGAALGATVKGGSILARSGLIKAAGKASNPLVSSGLSKAATAVDPAIKVGFMGDLGYHLWTAPSWENRFSLGKNIVVGGAGFKAGSGKAVQGYDIARTAGSKNIEVSKIVNKEVLLGDQLFPQTQAGATPNEVAASYLTSEGTAKGWHATPGNDYMGKEFPVNSKVKRPTDVPGLYISPEQAGVSPYFLRISGERTSPLSEIITGVKSRNPKQVKEAVMGTPEPLAPTILHIEVSKGVGRFSGEARTNPKAAKQYLLSEDAPKGRAHLTPVLEKNMAYGSRTEAEAIITPKTVMQQQGTEGFIKLNGRRVPIKEYKTVDPTETPQTIQELFGQKPQTIRELNLKTSIPSSTKNKQYRPEAPAKKGLIREQYNPLTEQYNPLTGSTTSTSRTGRRDAPNNYESFVGSPRKGRRDALNNYESLVSSPRTDRRDARYDPLTGGNGDDRSGRRDGRDLENIRVPDIIRGESSRRGGGHSFIYLPQLDPVQNTQNPLGDTWAARKKTHYVQDPYQFVFGTGKKGKGKRGSII